MCNGYIGQVAYSSEDLDGSVTLFLLAILEVAPDAMLEDHLNELSREPIEEERGLPCRRRCAKKGSFEIFKPVALHEVTKL